jgi:hypothetical protein
MLLQCSSFIPECQESLKPMVGMAFDSVDDVEKFYKSYVHESNSLFVLGSIRSRTRKY